MCIKEKIMKKVLAMLMTFVMVLSLTACGGSSDSTSDSSGSTSDTPSDSSETYTLKFGHDQPEDNYFNVAAEKFAELLHERSDGRITVEVYPAAQLGSEATMLESLSMGTLDFQISSSSNAAVYVPELAAMSCSYLFNDLDHLTRVAYDEEFQQYWRDLVAEGNNGFQLMSLFPATPRHLYTTFPVDNLAALKGRKIRVMSAPIESTVWGALGAKPTTVNFGEVYTALQTDLVEGAENSISSYYSAKHYEVAPYLNLTYHQYAILEMWVSDAVKDKLPADLYELIIPTAVDAAKAGLEYANDVENSLVEEMVANNGVTVVEPDISEFKEVILPIQDENVKELGCEWVLDFIREHA